LSLDRTPSHLMCVVFVCVCACVRVCVCACVQARSPRQALALAQTGLHGLRTLSSGTLGLESMLAGELVSTAGAGAGAGGAVGGGAAGGLESEGTDGEVGAVDSDDASPSEPEQGEVW
jgi:hypothetical protein